MFVRTEKPEDIDRYPIRVRNHSYADTATALSELMKVLPEIKGGDRTASNFLVVKTAPGYCNNVEYNFEPNIAEALQKLLEAIKSDLDKANQDGYIDGTSVLIRLNNGSLSLDDYEQSLKK